MNLVCSVPNTEAFVLLAWRRRADNVLEITAVQEEADEDLEAGRSSMALNWREKM